MVAFSRSKFDDLGVASGHLLLLAMSALAASHTPLADTTTLVETNGKRKRVISPEDTKPSIDNSHSEDKPHDRFYGLLQDILVILKRSAFPHVLWLALLIVSLQMFFTHY